MEQAINEDSPPTLEGSFTKDLIFSKMWLCAKIIDAMEVCRIDQFGTIAILGAWYGNMGLMIKLYGIPFRSMIVNDIDPTTAKIQRILLKSLGPRVETVTCDANDMDYRGKKHPLLIINTSCNEINGMGWFDRIPNGSLVALQSRSDFKSIERMISRFPMRSTIYVGSKRFIDPTEEYLRHSIIGLK